MTVQVIRRKMHARTIGPQPPAPARPRLAQADALVVPHPKRIVPVRPPTGGLRLHYGVTSVLIEAPELVALTEALLSRGSFRAGEVLEWGLALSWERARPLLTTLLDQDLLRRADAAAAVPELEPATARTGSVAQGRTWGTATADCPALAEQLTGLRVPTGYLEAVVPLCRIAHPAIDTDGRQVGEEEVVPRFLYLELPTELRRCSYEGSRYGDPMPMNVTALRLIMAQWDPIVSLAVELRDAVIARVDRRGPRWRLGDLHVLAVAILAAPAYLMMRGEQPVHNGALPSVLANLFKLVDGVRIATLTLLLDPDLDFGFDAELTADEVFDHCERLGLFLAAHGVCAGPTARIREFLDILMGGAAPRDPCAPQAADILGDVDAALDYAFAATQMECTVQRFLDRQHQVIGELLGHLGEPEDPEERRFAARLRDAYAAPAPLRTSRSLAFHPKLFREAGRYWAARDPLFCGSLAAAVGEPRAPTEDPLADALAHLPCRARRSIAAFFAEERATLATVNRQAQVINEIARREHPEQPLNGHQLQGRGRLLGADLGAALTDAYGGVLERTAERTQLTGVRRDASQHSPPGIS